MSRWRRWRDLLGRRWQLVLTVENADEIPDRLPARGIVLVGTTTTPKWIAFDCPCGTGHRIMLNTDPSRRPSWGIRSYSPLTLYPSIDDITALRRCHFWLHDGRVSWVRGLERSWRR